MLDKNDFENAIDHAKRCHLAWLKQNYEKELVALAKRCSLLLAFGELEFKDEYKTLEETIASQVGYIKELKLSISTLETKVS